MGYTETAPHIKADEFMDIKQQAFEKLQTLQAGEIDAAGGYGAFVAWCEENGLDELANTVRTKILNDEYQHFNIEEEEKCKLNPDYKKQAAIGKSGSD